MMLFLSTKALFLNVSSRDSPETDSLYNFPFHKYPRGSKRSDDEEYDFVNVLTSGDVDDDAGFLQETLSWNFLFSESLFDLQWMIVDQRKWWKSLKKFLHFNIIYCVSCLHFFRQHIVTSH